MTRYACANGLQVVLFELVRQSFVHCEERGCLLERIRVRFMHLREEMIAAARAGES